MIRSEETEVFNTGDLQLALGGVYTLVLRDHYGTVQVKHLEHKTAEFS